MCLVMGYICIGVNSVPLRLFWAWKTTPEKTDTASPTSTLVPDRTELKHLGKSFPGPDVWSNQVGGIKTLHVTK